MKTIVEYGGLKRLNELKNIYSGKKIFLVTGKASYENSGAKNIVDQYLVGEQVVHFKEFSTNPKISDALAGTRLARQHEIEVIIAIGGGSVIDIAKLIKAFYLANDNEIELVTGTHKVSDPSIPIIAIPTTAGSGSEATHFAVIYLGSDKYSLAATCLLPEVVILDGSLVRTGSTYLKACNSLDAMSQAIESYWAVGATDVSRKYAKDALQLGWSLLPHYVNGGCTDLQAQKMLEAAHLAGKAINISKTTAAHAWSYAFTSAYNIPHGHAVWLTLPAIFDAHFNATAEEIIEPKGFSYFKTIMAELCNYLSLDMDVNLRMQLKQFLLSIGVESRMEQLGASTLKNKTDLSNQVNIERLNNNPVNLNGKKSLIFNLC